MDENQFLEMISCESCPCKNNDYENGGSCNLDYEMDLYWTKNGIPDNLIYASFNCELEIVKHTGGGYKPVKVMARKKRTDGR